jgi:hypothetical protein
MSSQTQAMGTGLPIRAGGMLFSVRFQFVLWFFIDR